jgi:hypothetical protein
MPTNRFGAQNPQPLYNATGRINRGQAAPVPQFSAPAAGVSKDFGASNMPNNAAGAQGGFGANLMQSLYSGGNPLNVYDRGGFGGGGGGRRRGKKGDAISGDTIDNSITIGAFTGFGDNSGMTANQQGLGGQNLNAYNPNNSSATAQAPQRKQMTPEQRARNNATAKARRGLQASIAKEGTPEQQARVAKQGVAGGKARQPRAPKAQTAQPSVGGYSNNTSAPTIQANVTDARQASQTTSINSPHAPTGPGQPGAPAIAFGSVTGASMGNPAKIGSSKIGKR